MGFFDDSSWDACALGKADALLALLGARCFKLKKGIKRKQQFPQIFFTSSDVVISSESWLDESIGDSEVFFFFA